LNINNLLPYNTTQFKGEILSRKEYFNHSIPYIKKVVLTDPTKRMENVSLVASIEDLSLTNNKIFLLEHSEESPFFLMENGMVSRIRN